MNPNEELEQIVTEAIRKAVPIWTDEELSAVCFASGIQYRDVRLTSNMNRKQTCLRQVK